jgi:hypothetical protein
MANWTCLTICRINVLGNTQQELDLLSWHKVYNALANLVLTYRA